MNSIRMSDYLAVRQLQLETYQLPFCQGIWNFLSLGKVLEHPRTICGIMEENICRMSHMGKHSGRDRQAEGVYMPVHSTECRKPMMSLDVSIYDDCWKNVQHSIGYY